MTDLLIKLIPVFPLLAVIANGVFGRRFWSHEWAHRLAWGSVGLSFLYTILVFADIVRSGTPHEVVAYQWIFGGNLSINMAFLVDPLTCVMLLVVTGVGFLIHVYSVGYMHGEDGFTRFFVHEPVHGFDAALGHGQQLRRALHRMGRRRPVLVSADRLLL